VVKNFIVENVLENYLREEFCLEVGGGVALLGVRDVVYILAEFENRVLLRHVGREKALGDHRAVA
jgi:hypothetical protein